MSLIGLIVAVIVMCLLIWAVRYLMAAFAIPAQIQAVVTVLIVVIVCLWLLSALGLLAGGPMLRLR